VTWHERGSTTEIMNNIKDKILWKVYDCQCHPAWHLMMMMRRENGELGAEPITLR